MLQEKNGFSLIEVMISASILLGAVALFIPIISQVQMEQHILSERRLIANQLHSEIQYYIRTEEKLLPSGFYKQSSHTEIYFYFMKEDNFIKGCAQWQNAKKREENLCLYGLSTQ